MERPELATSGEMPTLASQLAEGLKIEQQPVLNEEKGRSDDENHQRKDPEEDSSTLSAEGAFSILPDELIAEIVRYVVPDLPSILSFGATCRRLFVLHENDRVWR